MDKKNSDIPIVFFTIFLQITWHQISIFKSMSQNKILNTTNIDTYIVLAHIVEGNTNMCFCRK